MKPKKVSLGKNIRDFGIEYAKENGLPAIIIDQIYKQYWKNIYDEAKSLSGYSFKIDNFGTLTTSANKCKKYIEILERKKNPKYNNIEELDAIISKVKETYHTIIGRKNNVRKIYSDRKKLKKLINEENK